ncbi:NADH-quinone oxidoreductase subunit D [candidate division KSB1 bacterium]|nr:NADH-quinone oxidoreductase subunit D [candidate division KSB1 bacterium]NIR72875.1 NADH-quinone oxidoreductase subunit D [candidate division KSB1 bacterium]NIS25152.1 NADH-quinone oxidoreductase subunit D [candidate division KSB1 bacterium]NIT72063.1 NADH-quinone oxidoreductase subunit D [candidate division KSB1 bacterium]NIU25854.1 NADH-quinone oxidoreductase subunit D [candidate division KSB1 bacterium]
MDHSAGRYYDDAMKKLEIESYEGDEMVVNMGPQHPSTHGVLRLELVLDGEVVKKVTPHIGYLHRNFEKHAENIAYNEVIPFCDRMDYLASMNQDMAYALAVEKLIGLNELPEKVEYIRILCCELNRIASHLVAIGTFGLDVGAFTPFLWAFRDREKILDLLEWISGARMLYNYIWVGGLAREMPEGWLEKIREFLDMFEPKMVEFNNLLTKNHIFIERTADVGVLPADVAVSYGCTGPVLRGSGVKWDIRKDEPYSYYDQFEFDVPVGTGEFGPLGSVLDRYLVRIEEINQSIGIIRQAFERIPPYLEQDVKSAIPRRIRPEAGAEAYVRSETPRGELGYLIRSDGSDVPYRVKARSPCFSNVSVIDEISRGAMVADLVIIIGSVDIVLGCVDR